jgi:hypothetical protein
MSRPREIPAVKARELRLTGMTWPQVAAALSVLHCRRPPFQAVSVQHSVRRLYGTARVK